MLCIFDKTTNPYYNLACEEYLLKNFEEPIFRLWRNEPSVIVGCNQNTLAEINHAFVRENNIPVVRRLSGGGAVFHDLGNINYSFFMNKISNVNTNDIFRRFTRPIINALKTLEVNAALEGRNDLTVDGKKISGNAVHIDRSRILHHGTLLFSASIANLSGALQSRPEKFIDKAVKSTRSRVSNISEHLKKSMLIEEFIIYLQQHILTALDEFTYYDYTPKDIEAIQYLTDTKYATDEWNYGKSPVYTFSKVKRTEGGIVEIYLNVERGMIVDLKILGDFFGAHDIAFLEETLKGCEHQYKAIINRLCDVNLNDFISNVSKEDFIDIFFNS